MPALWSEFRFSDWFIKLSMWQESDVYAFDNYQYTLYLYQTALLGGGYKLTPNQVIQLNGSVIERIYPSQYSMQKNELQVSYQWKKPLKFSDTIQWREMSLRHTQTRYSDVSVNKSIFANSFKFLLFGLTHFVDYKLLYTDSITLYKEGLYQYSLVEVDEKTDDIRQIFTYSGFTRIGESTFFLSWKYNLDDSIVENSVLDHLVQLKLVYAF